MSFVPSVKWNFPPSFKQSQFFFFSLLKNVLTQY